MLCAIATKKSQSEFLQESTSWVFIKRKLKVWLIFAHYGRNFLTKPNMISSTLKFFVENGKVIGCVEYFWILLAELDDEDLIFFRHNSTILATVQYILPAFVIDCDWVLYLVSNEVPWDLKEIPSGHSTRDLDLVASKNIWHGSLLYIDPNIIIIVFDCLLKLHSAVV